MGLLSPKDERARKLQDEMQPELLISCPMCGPFSTWMALNFAHKDTEDVKEILKKALEDLKFGLELCVRQHHAGRLFVFEHPIGATSWGTSMMEKVSKLGGVQSVAFDFCTLGMRTTDREGNDVAAKKRTRVLTNSGHVAAALERCQCRGGHVHGVLEGGRPKNCQEYPRYFCELIVTAIERELADTEWLGRIYKTLDANKSVETHVDCGEDRKRGEVGDATS